ncbi:hypothetical protein BGZ63DRAFT_408580 [Mariannaea sp. PMI_226]|nr:hypothetical protein BGZ63DRAFT_408580 [Mariannaea sp. PMI_226]
MTGIRGCMESLASSMHTSQVIMIASRSSLYRGVMQTDEAVEDSSSRADASDDVLGPDRVLILFDEEQLRHKARHNYNNTLVETGTRPASIELEFAFFFFTSSKLAALNTTILRSGLVGDSQLSVSVRGWQGRQFWGFWGPRGLPTVPKLKER